MKHLFPKECYNTIYDIDLTKLYNQGIRGLLIDLDDTLVPRKDPDIPTKTINWIINVKKQGFSICITSNSYHPQRVKRIAQTLDIPHIALSFKPLPFAFQRSLNILDLPPGKVAVIGDQLFMDILGGNWCGMYTILVKYKTRETFFPRQLMRAVESLILDRLQR